MLKRSVTFSIKVDTIFPMIDHPENQSENTNDTPQPSENEQIIPNISPPSPENESELPQSSDSSQKRSPFIYFILFFISFIIIIVFIFIFFRKPIVSDKPFPYIFNSHFNDYLHLYTQQEIHKEILLVHGPSGSGKTRGFKLFAEDLLNDGHLIIHFDFAKFSSRATQADLISFMKQSILQSFLRYDGHQSKTADCKTIAAVIEAHATVDGPLLKTKPYFRDPHYQTILNSFLTIFDRIRLNPHAAIRDFMTCLESLSIYSPVLIINNINYLSKSSSHHCRIVLSTFWQCISTIYANELHPIPIIIEISNELSLIDGTTPTNLTSMRLLRLDDFSIRNAIDVLVKKERIFKKKDLAAIYQKVGGHGKSFATIYDMLKEGETLEVAYDRMFTHTKNLLRRIVTPNTTSAYSGSYFNYKLAYIKQLKNSRILPVSFDRDSCENLLNWKVISLLNSTHVVFSDKIIRDAVTDLLSNS